MIVRLTRTDALVAEADDCARLHVGTTLAPDEVDAALRATGTGRLAEDGNALLDLRTLHARARSAAASADWADRWEAMIAYARKKGWITADGTAVQAHVEAAPTPRA
ncbi:hypothetical protein [Amycolatopsis dongchuanensis]|uniref:Lsr2 protein n=1 Tax=Amycolatopsis dongchuanensis TaxID=1070866 RepID=A0ABP8VD04_9PSEU|nr:hypothetical protein HQ32_04903 [Prauserella sp. Am3]